MKLSEMTKEELEAFEKWLYDCEVEGVDCWFSREQVLRELASREDEK